MKKTNYKWIDTDREKRTTDNPIWWLKGLLIIVAIAASIIALVMFK